MSQMLWDNAAPGLRVIIKSFIVLGVFGHCELLDLLHRYNTSAPYYYFHLCLGIRSKNLDKINFQYGFDNLWASTNLCLKTEQVLSGYSQS